MKAKFILLVLAFSAILFTVQAQRRVVTTTRAMSYDISDNLDLEAVASIFGDSKDLEDFEYRLNDPDNRISNLDLNQDGYIDYLRVVENSDDRNSLVVIQAVLDQDIYQDVATIEIERRNNGKLLVQVVGDPYIYGSNYIIEPVFVSRPVIFSFFWSAHYRPYYSPYYWNYYPGWYSYYEPYPTYKYHKHIHHHIDHHITYHRPADKHIHISRDRYDRISRNDYASRYPDKAFSKRHDGYSNKYELERRRPTSSNTRDRNTSAKRPNNRELQSKGQNNSSGRDRTENVYQSRRPSTNVESGSGNNRPGKSREIRIDEQNNAGRPDGSGNVYQSRRPAPKVQSESGNGRTRENQNINNNTNRQGPSREPVQVKSGNRNESQNSGSVSRNRTAPTSSPSRPGNQVDSRASSPREKSGTISNSSRISRENAPAPQNTRNAESPKSEENKGSGNGRRR